MKRSGKRLNVACSWPQLHPLDDPALRWTDHNNLMCHRSTPNRLISNTDNLEDDWQAVRTDERAARPAQLLLFQTGTEVTVREECLGRGVRASWSCLCLPLGGEAEEWLMQMSAVRSTVKVRLKPCRSDGFCQAQDIKEPVRSRGQLQMIQPGH